MLGGAANYWWLATYCYILILSVALFGTFCNAFSPLPTLNGIGHTGRIVLHNEPTQTMSERKREKGARVAFIGNSIQYFNDCPRFLVNLGKGSIKHQDSCFRGGTNLSELLDLGNGMKKHGFATKAAKIDGTDNYDVGSPTVEALLGCNDGNIEKWDFVVLNDHTQGPARPASRKAMQQTLIEHYLPLILENGATPIIIETAAYRFPEINNSKDLGSAQDFQQRVKEGVDCYLEVLRPRLPEGNQPRMAPVGTAFLMVHNDNHALWEKLFDPYDNFHPSPSGTFLQGCVLHCTMFGSPPPFPSTKEEIASLWSDARMMHSRTREEDRPLPSVKEAEYLWNVAKNICCEGQSEMHQSRI